MGRSYGGYLTLAALTFHPELFAAGVDMCGMSDLLTFYARPSPGSPRSRRRSTAIRVTDAALLAELSPLRRFHRLRAPLLVVHGVNDRNVPVSESRQAAAAARERGVEAQLLLFPDEGHEIARVSREGALRVGRHRIPDAPLAALSFALIVIGLRCRATAIMVVTAGSKRNRKTIGQAHLSRNRNGIAVRSATSAGDRRARAAMEQQQGRRAPAPGQRPRFSVPSARSRRPPPASPPRAPPRPGSPQQERVADERSDSRTISRRRPAGSAAGCRACDRSRPRPSG